MAISYPITLPATPAPRGRLDESLQQTGTPEMGCFCFALEN